MSAAVATTSVGARSSFAASFSPATPSARRASPGRARGSATAGRGGASARSRATASSSSSVSRGTGSGPNALCVRRAAASSVEASREPGGDVDLAPARLRSCGERTALVRLRDRRLQRGVVDAVDARRRSRRCEPTIWCPCPSTSSMTIVHATSSWPGRRAGARQLAGERHRDAAAVRGREQLLGARLPAGIADARGQRERQLRERAARRRRACRRRGRAFPSQPTCAVRSMCGI